MFASPLRAQAAAGLLAAALVWPVPAPLAQPLESVAPSPSPAARAPGPEDVLLIRPDCSAALVAPDGAERPAPAGTYRLEWGSVTVRGGRSRPCRPSDGDRAIGSKGGFAIGGFNPA